MSRDSAPRAAEGHPTHPISMVALGPEDAAERTQWIEALARVVDHHGYCLGREVEELEERMGAILDGAHVLGFSNGTDALRLALQAVGVQSGDAVLVPAMSFFASASSIAHLGAQPLFVDVDPGTLNLDPDAVAARLQAARGTPLERRIKALVAVHLYGQGAALDRLTQLCEAHGIALIEDAAQAFGVRYQGRPLGTLGAIGSYSFYPTKNLGAPGDAGLVATRDARLAERVRLLRVHGDRGGYHHELMGWNARMDGFQAAILKLRLDRFTAHQARRQAHAEHYLAGLRRLELLERVRPLTRTPGSEHGWHQFIVRVADRDEVRRKLLAEGVPSAVYYPSTLPLQPAFAELGHRPGDFPAAEQAAREILALPVHQRLQREDLDRVLTALARAVA